MAADDYAGLRERTLQRHRLERQYGRYEGRKPTPPLGIPFGGDFGRWLRTAWSETVGTTGPAAKAAADAGSAAHEVWGAAVAVMIWSDEAETKTDRTVVAQYLAREAGKWRQKQPPPGFVKVGRFCGVWGPGPTAIRCGRSVFLIQAMVGSWPRWRFPGRSRMISDTRIPARPSQQDEPGAPAHVGVVASPDEGACTTRWLTAAGEDPGLRDPGVSEQRRRPDRY
jgi:hypothetical protein